VRLNQLLACRLWPPYRQRNTDRIANCRTSERPFSKRTGMVAANWRIHPENSGKELGRLGDIVW
jgi:hypothetical protein